MVADWHLWALIAAGYVSMALGQASLQTGRLAPSVATQTALDPITSLLLGAFAFDESIHETTFGVIAALIGIVSMVTGIVVLANTTQQQQLPATAAA
jgi:hypothetical protein